MAELYPILEPGRPGDLMMILNVSLEQLRMLRDAGSHPSTAHSVAVTTLHALCAWLGIVEVPRVPEVKLDG